MYALIYDEHQIDQPLKKVISVHETRDEADIALENRKRELGRTVYECNTRIVWTDKNVSCGDSVGPREYDTWRAGERIPEGEQHDDSD
ncbi:MAG: hypothetical protein K9K64_16690 [Desulfohalobiaceae bacterium]|nr:hypothetical protein [Desulfohalobiaceae bacterium]